MKQWIALLLSLAAAVPAQAPQHDWPQWRGPNRDGVWREPGIVKQLPEKLEIAWRAPVNGGYCGPTVAAHRVFVMDRVTEPEEIERVLCFDSGTGEAIWKHEYPCQYSRVSYTTGPRCSVHIDDDLAFSLGTMGHLHCLKAETGERVWSKDLDAEYPIDMPRWGISAAPVIEDDLLIVPVSGKDAYLVAFDRASGEERWKAFSDRGNYSAPIVIDQAGRRVLICWSGDRVLGVAPATGKLLWEYPFRAKNMPLGVASPILHGDRLFVTGFYDGCALLRLDQDKPAVEEIWRRRGRNERSTDGLHCIISTPIALEDHIYGVDSYGELRCLALEDGKRIWEDRTAVPRARWATIHFVRHEDRVFMFNDRGDLMIGMLSPDGFEELSRTHLIDPTRGQLSRRDGVCWSHPAFAYGHVFIRNDEELVCAKLTADQ